jgi:hypothetical protein
MDGGAATRATPGQALLHASRAVGRRLTRFLLLYGTRAAGARGEWAEWSQTVAIWLGPSWPIPSIAGTRRSDTGDRHGPVETHGKIPGQKNAARRTFALASKLPGQAGAPWSGEKKLAKIRSTPFAFFVALLVAVLLGGHAAPASAMTCALYSEQGAQIRLPGTGQIVSTPYQSAHCENSTIIRGQAEVCFARADGQPTCTAAPTGSLTASRLGAQPTGNTAFMAGLVRLLNDTRTGTGKVRMTAAAIPLEVPGFPYRRVLPQAGPLAIPLAAITPTRLDDFRLYDMSVNENLDIRRVYDSGPVTGTVVIPANRLKPGIDYEWKAMQGERRLSGAFHAATFREAAQMRERLDRIETDPTLSPYGKKILAANAYAEAGFTLNAQQLLLPAQFPGAPPPAANWGRSLSLGCP